MYSVLLIVNILKSNHFGLFTLSFELGTLLLLYFLIKIIIIEKYIFKHGKSVLDTNHYVDFD